MTEKELFKELTTSTPFYFICILFLGLAGLSQLVLLETSTINTQLKRRSFRERIHLTKRLAALFTNKNLQFLMIISSCFTLAVDIFYQFGPVYLTVKWTLGPAQLVLYNGVLCLALAFGSGWLPSLISKRVSTPLAVIYSMGGFALFLVGVVFANSQSLMLMLFALSGFVIGLAETLLTVRISNTALETIQGEVMGVQISLRVLGDALICLFGGVLLLLSPKLILTIAAMLAIAAIGPIWNSTQKSFW